MLNYYTDVKYIPAGMVLVRKNNSHFDSVHVEGTDEVKRVLSEIDRSEYISSSLYKSGLINGAMGVAYLSTGCKTALNILSDTNICFDLIQCGDNAIRSILKMEKGNVLCDSLPVVFGAGKCSIVVNNEYVCNNLREFKEALTDVFFS